MKLKDKYQIMKIRGRFSRTLNSLVRMHLLKCDNCGKISPKMAPFGKALCGEDACFKEGGFYGMEGSNKGTNGKVLWLKLRFPVTIKWRGFTRF